MGEIKQQIDGSGRMFDKIAKRYDLLNFLTSMGQDKRWRRIAVESLNIKSGRILDLAAGTFDVSIEIAKQSGQIAKQSENVKIAACDPSKNMLLQGVKKIKDGPFMQSITPVLCTGENLPFSQNIFDGVTIAFGIRNFSNRTIALNELQRVLKKDAKMVILELHIPKKGLMGLAAGFYAKKIIPLLGALLSSKDQYVYLPESMDNFPSPSDFTIELESSGFSVLFVKNFLFGVCNMFVCKNSTY
ncbi:MAG: ubiquinone/menaquinone biosynthesis methyltransferase [Deltaproteobacteria bacterium]|nr:ubiquinone/menaquinone biosynthesis methyltransferase [Deltaproteobacteria bacterium]